LTHQFWPLKKQVFAFKAFLLAQSPPGGTRNIKPLVSMMKRQPTDTQTRHIRVTRRNPRGGDCNSHSVAHSFPPAGGMSFYASVTSIPLDLACNNTLPKPRQRIRYRERSPAQEQAELVRVRGPLNGGRKQAPLSLGGRYRLLFTPMDVPRFVSAESWSSAPQRWPVS
jgi:hypothetical protein